MGSFWENVKRVPLQVFFLDREVQVEKILVSKWIEEGFTLRGFSRKRDFATSASLEEKSNPRKQQPRRKCWTERSWFDSRLCRDYSNFALERPLNCLKMEKLWLAAKMNQNKDYNSLNFNFIDRHYLLRKTWFKLKPKNPFLTDGTNQDLWPSVMLPCHESPNDAIHEKGYHTVSVLASQVPKSLAARIEFTAQPIYQELLSDDS